MTNDDERFMDLALDAARSVRTTTSPNPWVGAVVVGEHHQVFVGATQPNRGPHAEPMALGLAKDAGRNATLYATLEPCSHTGRNPPCVDAIIASGVSRVVVALTDPDPRVSGTGIDTLRAAGIDVTVGVRENEARALLAPYLKHRNTGRPFVVLKMAMTLDGRTAAPDGTSQWITGAVAREDVHRLRSESEVIVVGAGTVRADDPSLTVRRGERLAERQPLRVVLGAIPEGARVLPARSWTEGPEALLAQLGAEGHLQVLVEGGAQVAGDFHRNGLVDQYVIYVAPALTGGSDSVPLMSGAGIATMADLWRGKLTDVTQFGDDVRLTIEPV